MICTEFLHGKRFEILWSFWSSLLETAHQTLSAAGNFINKMVKSIQDLWRLDENKLVFEDHVGSNNKSFTHLG